jgi:hypothetical protein
MRPKLVLRFAAAVAVLALSAPSAPAAFLVQYDFTGAAGNQAFQSPASAATGITAQNLTRGPGITAVAGANSINSSGWSSTTIFGPTLTDYYQFSLTVQAGYTANISSLSFSFQHSDTGPSSITVLHSLTNFATVPPGFSGWSTSRPADRTATDHLDLLYNNATQFPDLQNFTGTLTFRIYAYRATSSAGTFRLGVDAANNPNGYAPTLVLEGTVTPTNVVPAPPGLVLGAMGIACVGLARLRRRSPVVA